MKRVSGEVVAHFEFAAPPPDEAHAVVPKSPSASVVTQSFEDASEGIRNVQAFDCGRIIPLRTLKGEYDEDPAAVFCAEAVLMMPPVRAIARRQVDMMNNFLFMIFMRCKRM
jgi:hypothetical protein